MQAPAFESLKSKVAEIPHSQAVGRVVSTDGHTIEVSGLEKDGRMGDRVRLIRSDGSALMGDILRLNNTGVTVLPDTSLRQVALSNRVTLCGQVRIAPHASWLGRVIDPYGKPLDGSSLVPGPTAFDLENEPPSAMSRKPMGPRLRTGFHLLNTMLPIARGQRLGIFAGSGVGKSTLLADLVRSMEADVIVLALVGERGREITEFTQNVLGAQDHERAIVIAATADSAPTARLRCPLTAMRIAEYFRDAGLQVLLFVDSITRFAEAHREVAVSAGEFPSLRGFPPSTPSRVTKLAERAGPGPHGAGDITAIFTVLVAASDLNEPVADMLRGVLDGHVVLDRKLADQGKFPAISTLDSVSRSLPSAADAAENDLITRSRHLLARYHEASALIEAGLYTGGGDPELDQAIAFRNFFSEFIKTRTDGTIQDSFGALRLCLLRSGALKD